MIIIKLEKLIPITLMLGVSFVCCAAGWYLGNGWYESGDAGAVIGFMLPTFIMYWLSKIKIPEDDN